MPINGDKLQRLEALFTEAVEKSPAERSAFLDQACATDVKLRAEVESLLRYDSETSEDFFRPVVLTTGHMLGKVSDGPDPLVGVKIERYTIEAVIASGGMGTVYRARQDNPAREVALKVMHEGMFARSALKRFEHEAQILAKLRHPNIAQVYDAGVAEVVLSHQESSEPSPQPEDLAAIRSNRAEAAGLPRTIRVPYFAMEYIPNARSITQWCDLSFVGQAGRTPSAAGRRYGMRERLELFLQVCDAVHHGHQKGIIHRDLKPANMLVDAEGHAKVIDFGVARSTDADIAVTTMQTDVGQLIGTVQYMSPEQCQGDSHEIDIRTDVYSLGVVLYELLCGRLPYDVSETSIYEATRTIREAEPARPSSISGGNTGVQAVRGDIETVVLKALEKDRARRYQSAAELADDIGRVLNSEPISARPPTLIYQAAKFARRNKALVGGILATILALIGGLVGTTWYARQALRYADQVVAEKDKAVVAQKEAIEAKNNAELKAEELAHTDYRQQIAAAQAAIAERRIEQAEGILHGIKEQRQHNWEWQYFQSHLRQSLRSAKFPGARFARIAVDPGSSRIAVALSGRENVVRIYDRDWTDLHKDIRVDGNHASAITFNNDGSLLAVAMGNLTGLPQNSSLQIWRADNWSLQHSFDDLFDPGGYVIAFHPRRNLLAVAGVQIKLLDLSGDTDPESRVTLCGQEDGITCLAFSPDGRWLAAGSQDYTVCLWDINQALLTDADSDQAMLPRRAADLRNAGPKEFRPSLVLRGHTDHVYSVTFDPSGKLLASGSADCTIRIWDADQSLQELSSDPNNTRCTGVCLNILTGHDGCVRAVAFDPTSPRLFSASDDRTLRIWEVDQSAIIANRPLTLDWRKLQVSQIRSLQGHDIVQLAVLPTGRILSIAADSEVNNAMALWHPDFRDTPVLEGHNTSVTAVTFTPDDQFIVSGDGAEGIFMWDAQRCVPVASQWLERAEMVSALACWRSGERTFLAAATGDADYPQIRAGRVRLWGLDHACKPAPLGFLEPDRLPCFCALAADSGGRRLVAGDMDGVVRVWNAAGLPETREPILTFRAHNAQVLSLVFLDEAGQWLVSGSGDRWGEADTKRRQKEHTIKLWDLESLIRNQGSEPASQVSSIESRPAAAARALANDDTSLSREIWRYEGHADLVRSLARWPRQGKGEVLASASFDETIHLWNISWNNGRPVLQASKTLSGHKDGIYVLAFHPTEPRLASGSLDRTIKLWDIATGTEVATLRGQLGGVSDLAFSFDGRRLASASRGSLGTDNTVHLWENLWGEGEEDEAKTRELLEQRAIAMRAYDEVRRVFSTAVPTIADARREIERKHLPDDVKKSALDHFDAFLPTPLMLDRRARSVFDRRDRGKATEEDYSRALAWADKAIEIGPELGPTWNAKGIIKYRLKQYDEAIDLLRKARELSQGRPWQSNQACLALIYHELGRSNEEEQMLEELREADNDAAQTLTRFWPEEQVSEIKEMIGEAQRLMRSSTAEASSRPEPG